MENVKNITLDFSQEKSLNGLTAGQPLAIMPATIADQEQEMKYVQ